MARTRNPHEAALKAWQTRHRGVQQAPARDAGAVRTNGDWRFPHDPGKDPSKLLSHPWGKPADLRSIPAGDGHAEVERQMRESPPARAKFLGNGVAGAYKVYLENGMEGNFKPQYNDRGVWRNGIQPGQNAEREAATWEIAKIVGMDDMVARAVIREVKVPDAVRQAGGWDRLRSTRGSFAEWAEGETAYDVPQDRRFGSVEEMQRVAMFDFVTGNQDRHQGNWVVQANGKVKLIDHGLTFGETERAKRADGHDQFSREVLAKARAGRTEGGMGDFAKFAEPYIRNKERILRVLEAQKLPRAAIERAKHRLERLAEIASRRVYSELQWQALCTEPM